MFLENSVHPVPLVICHLEVFREHVNLLTIFHLLDQRLDIVRPDCVLLEVEVDGEEQYPDAKGAEQDGPPPRKACDVVNDLHGGLDEAYGRVPSQSEA